jgi:Ca-activated chloride channel family protein
MKQVILVIAMVGMYSLEAQKVNESIRSGNDLYRKQQYDQAQKEYSNALKTQPGNNTAKFNMANTTYRLDKQEEAIRSYDEISKTEPNIALRSKAYYNKGAILSKQKKLEESIEAYKSTLRLNPDDKEARENLQKALLELKKKQPPKEKKEDQKKKQDQQKKQQQPKMSQKEAEQRLKLLEQKEKQVQERLQKEKSRTGGSQTKDW